MLIGTAKKKEEFGDLTPVRKAIVSQTKHRSTKNANVIQRFLELDIETNSGRTKIRFTLLEAENMIFSLKAKIRESKIQ